MTWRDVAWKDFSDAVRSKALWVLSLLFVLLVAGSAYLVSGLRSAGGGGAALTSDSYVLVMSGAGAWFTTAFVALIGLFTAYSAVVGERSSGSLKILLGLPHSRRDVVFGKVVGRSAVVSASIAVGFVAGLAVMFLLYDSVSLPGMVLFTLLTAALGVAWVCIGVGLSSAFGSGRVVSASAFGMYFAAKFLWDPGLVPRGVVALYRGLDTLFGPQPPWFDFIRVVSPNEAYAALAGSVATGNYGTLQVFSAGVLLFWIALPPLLGYLRFREMDLS